MDSEFVKTSTLCTLLEISSKTCQRRRKDGSWTKGVHWVQLNSRTFRYNLPLIKDWLVNQGYTEAHRRAVDIYLESLTSSKEKKRGRKAGYKI